MQVQKIKSLFDQNKDGVLNESERQRAKEFLAESPQPRRRPPSSRAGSGDDSIVSQTLSPEDVESFPEASLYDEGTLRTLFLTFPNDTWESELEAFWKTDIDVPASLEVDQNSFDDIGIRFRGSSSFFTVSPGSKRSLNLSIDYANTKQRLYGYKTLNLLNAHTDPSYVRTVIFSHIARNYIPAPKANYVRLVINGQSWGIYVNSQQFNRDFLKEWFGTRDGVRWKMLPNPRGGFGMGFLGDQLLTYEEQYVMKSSGDDRDWKQLIKVFRALKETPTDELESTLDPMLNLDRALWFLALENVFVDNDGYWTRASDFALYLDPNNRLHMIPHDSNETFRPPRGFGGSASGIDVDPLFGTDDDSKPLIHHLLKSDRLRARYLAHVRTLRDEWLTWDRIGPLVDTYQALIDADMASDPRKHDTYEAFKNSATESSASPISLKGFVDARRRYLDQHPELKKPAPQFLSVTLSGKEDTNVAPGEMAEVVAQFDPENQPNRVTVYFSEKKHQPFMSIPMEPSSPNSFRATLPEQPAGEKAFYYVEARIENTNTSAYFPNTAEFRPLAYRVVPSDAARSPLRINEIVASNVSILADPQGDFDDWIELYNQSEETIDLSGLYLSDSAKNPRKWSFPDGTKMAPRDYLIIWADEDEDEGLHANFKLSKKGETIGLYDRDSRANQRLDQVTFESLDDDQSWALVADRPQRFSIANPTPLAPNPTE